MRERERERPTYRQKNVEESVRLDFLHGGMKIYSVVTNLIFPRMSAIEK
jgi:hypothetical protein